MALVCIDGQLLFKQLSSVADKGLMHSTSCTFPDQAVAQVLWQGKQADRQA